MTYGTYITIKEALEALNLRDNVSIIITNGVISIDDLQDMLDAEYERGYERGYEQAQEADYISW